MTATSVGSPARGTAGGHDIRALTRLEDVAQAAEVFRGAMIGIPVAPGYDVTRLHEPGRTLGAFDGDIIVGSADAYTSWLTVPGGARVPHAAVTHVGVLPSHTRRGIMTALMNRQLADIAGRGEVVASLRASEALIYERFGYGIATRSASYEISRRNGGLRPTVPPGSPVRLAGADGSEELLRGISAKAAWVGSMGRFDAWWNGRALRAAAHPGPRHVAVSGAEGSADGYALYRPADTSDWFGSRHRAVVVDDFVATSTDAYLGLIQYLVALDLIDAFRLESRPIDEPLAALFTDARSVRHLGERDETWLRLIDVAAALSARSYQAGHEVVIRVSDHTLPANSGSYRVGAHGAERTDKEPHIRVDVAALASVYLGGARWRDLALAGTAAEHRPGAIQNADALFATPTAPFAGTRF